MRSLVEGYGWKRYAAALYRLGLRARLGLAGLAGLVGGKGLEFSGAGGLALGLAGEMGAETVVGRGDSADISGFSFTWWVSEGRCAGWVGCVGSVG